MARSEGAKEKFSVPRYRRFHGRGRHLVGRAKNSDGLGRVIVSG